MVKHNLYINQTLRPAHSLKEIPMTLLAALPLLAIIDCMCTAILAIPAWLLWTVSGLGARYFAFLPTAWQSMPLLHMAGLFLLFAVVRIAAPGIRAELKA